MRIKIFLLIWLYKHAVNYCRKKKLRLKMNTNKSFSRNQNTKHRWWEHVASSSCHHFCQFPKNQFNSLCCCVLFFEFLYLCSSGLTFKNNSNIFSKWLFWSISVDGWDMAQGEEKSCTAAESLIYESGRERLQFLYLELWYFSS